VGVNNCVVHNTLAEVIQNQLMDSILKMVNEKTKIGSHSGKDLLKTKYTSSKNSQINTTKTFLKNIYSHMIIFSLVVKLVNMNIILHNYAKHYKL
jgi:DhnA family fructose-bisphosphate aldolase class Ia